MMAPSLAAAVQNPIAAPLTLVGYTSGVYTYTAWNTPVAKARRVTPHTAPAVMFLTHPPCLPTNLTDCVSV